MNGKQILSGFFLSAALMAAAPIANAEQTNTPQIRRALRHENREIRRDRRELRADRREIRRDLRNGAGSAEIRQDRRELRRDRRELRQDLRERRQLRRAI